MNAPVIADRFENVAAYLGIKGGFNGFCDFVQDFNDSMKIPHKLSEMGVGTDRIDELVVMALKDPSTGGNPVKMTTANTKALFEATI